MLDDKAMIISYEEKKNEDGYPYFESMDIKHFIRENDTITVNKKLNVRCINNEETIFLIFDDFEYGIAYDQQSGILTFIDYATGRHIWKSLSKLKNIVASKGFTLSQMDKMMHRWKEKKPVHRPNSHRIS
ncbi:MAG: hypothetical protein IKP88_18255 [Lachnospiraceae bacterium]|nr:hypothetical protein [Lachnospiraceae bacterium]